MTHDANALVAQIVWLVFCRRQENDANILKSVVLIVYNLDHVTVIIGLARFINELITHYILKVCGLACAVIKLQHNLFKLNNSVLYYRRNCIN